jgi:hypothetical protein
MKQYTSSTRPRPAAAMPGHALALAFKHTRSDTRDARRMVCFLGLRRAVTTRARMMILSGLAGGMP